MKRTACWMLMMTLVVPAAWATLGVEEDNSADPALLTWTDPVPWQVGVTYLQLLRPVKLDKADLDLKGNNVEGEIGVMPWPWLLLYGQAGATEARLSNRMGDNGDAGAGGLLGLKVNVWQIYEGVHRAAWRTTLQLAGQYAYRTTGDGGEGKLEWGEALVMLPVNYHLTFARSFRNMSASEFQAIEIYAGHMSEVARRNGLERDFEESQSFGVVGGANMWLLENLCLGARADWFDGTSLELSILYRF